MRSNPWLENVEVKIENVEIHEPRSDVGCLTKLFSFVINLFLFKLAVLFFMFIFFWLLFL